jgi:type IV pilus assembly protein PilY1
LVDAVKAAITIIREATYSFSQSSIQSSRTADENYIYEGSFQPITGDPFWHGHLRRYTINTANGQVGESADWDAGLVLKDNTTAASRVIKTYKSGSLQDFIVENTNITKEALAVGTDSERDAVIGYIRGESASNPDNWKLGDVFRSTPITVGEPSAYFDDIRDTSNPSAFSQHRNDHLRKTSPYSGRLIIAGANDGQLHAFRTSDGHEAWSFIPPNILARLKLITHATEPTSLTHQYYVDGPVTVADAWVPGSWSNGRSKSKADWYTLMISAEGRGAGTNLWSSSTSCDSGFNPAYTSAYPNYCGYYALNLSNSQNPASVRSTWVRFSFSAAQAPYMGAPWSKVMVGRVLDGGNEKWVGFVGGGAYAPGAAESGKGFFIVDLATGTVLWSYTKADNANLNYPMPAPPSIVDTDNDGFIDTVYLGDLGGHVWRFKLCLGADGDSCGTSNWTGGRLFQASSSGPIYTSAAVSKDGNGNIWVYWATGDKLDPTNATTSDKIFAVKDDRTSTRTIGNLQEISGSSVFNDATKTGYYITLGTGEKVLADAAVFGGVLYATTFTPSSSTDPCYQGGTAKLYGLNFTTGAGALNIPDRTDHPTSIDIGTGIPSAPIISLRPTSGVPDLYVTTSGSGVIGAQTQRAGINPPSLANRTNLLFWRDRRAE